MTRDEFDQAVTEHYGYLVSWASRWVAEPEDIVHDAILAAMVGPDEDPPRPPKFAFFEPKTATVRTWLTSFVAQCVRGHYRDEDRKARAKERFSQTLTERVEPKFTSRLGLKEAVESALGCLDPVTAKVIKAVYMYDRTFKEVAKELGVKETMLRKRAQRAFPLLRELLHDFKEYRPEVA